MTHDFRSQTVVITGASSGIGRSFATALAERGANLVLVARRIDRLVALADELQKKHGMTATPIAADLGAATGVVDLVAELAARGIAVTSLINNAGFGTWGMFADEDPAVLAQEIAVDILAPVQLTHALLPAISAAGTGFIINVASMAAYNPTPRMAVYGASKAFVLSFTESLWAEHRASGVTIFALSPGATRTEFNDVVGTENATAGATMRSPEDVVATALAHLTKRNPGPSVIDGTGNRLSAIGIRVLSRRSVAMVVERLTDPSRRK